MKDQIDNVLADRQTTHGNYADTSRTAQHLRQAMREGNNWFILTDMQRESLDMIAMKIARIMSGDPSHADHWDDITGYARLVSVELHNKPERPGAVRPGGMIPIDPLGVPAHATSDNQARSALEQIASLTTRPRAVE